MGVCANVNKFGRFGGIEYNNKINVLYYVSHHTNIILLL